MKVNVEVSEVTLDSVIGEQGGYDAEGEVYSRPLTLREAVIHEVARQALAKQDREDWRSLSKVIEEVRTGLLRELLLPTLTEALTTPVTPTSPWGEPVGAPTTLTSVIEKEFREVLAERVDDRGQTGYMSDRKSHTRLEWMIRQAVQAVVGNELKAEIEAAKTELRETLQQVAAARLAEAVPVR